MPQVIPDLSNTADHGGAAKSKAKRPDSPLQLAFTLPSSIDNRVNLHLTNYSHALLLFLDVTAGSTPSASLGTLVYALPDVSRKGS